MTGLTPIVRVVSAALALAAGAGLTAEPQSLAPLPDVLAKAGSYLADYQDRVTMVMLEEDYTQRRTYTWATSNVGANAVSTESKRLRSDVVMSVEPGPRWVTFRDVFEVDGRAVRDRDERLAKLFLAPTDQTVDQAGRILAEGARFNIYPQLNRTLNVPFTTLVFLLTAHQPRSTFTIDGTETVGGQPTVVLRFVEHGTPRILKSDDGAAARGTFWIEPMSGRVLRSELVFTSSGKGIGSVTATIRVTYAQESRTGLWLPTVMDERYAFANLATSIITGTARYSNARQFAVDTNSNVKPLAK
jgi:hypothetical protein